MGRPSMRWKEQFAKFQKGSRQPYSLHEEKKGKKKEKNNKQLKKERG
jgi:hypothetical protein